MADFVDGDGWISDESSFYGDEPTKRELERKTKRKLKLPYQYPVKRRRVEKSAPPSGQPKGSGVDALSFLKSRPQIGGMQKTAAKEWKSTKQESVRTVAGEESTDYVDDTRFEGNDSARQHNETVDAFLKRAPVLDPESSNVGYWLWVGNPKPMRSHLKPEKKTNFKTFNDGGSQLLERFSEQRAELERLMPDRAPATITRKLRPDKERLEDDLLSLAVKTSMTSGKWMLFPSAEDYPRTWRLVAEATAAGKLGTMSKAATPNEADPLLLICIYTYDFTDLDDSRRVLEALVDLGLCHRDGKPIHYKCDAYTHLNISSDNEYKLRASMYSSKEIFRGEVMAKASGPIARLMKMNGTINSFFAS